MKVYDGQFYEDDAQVHDLGSFECVKREGVNRRYYEGLSADVKKLPKYSNLEAGSTAFCLDTGVFYKYHAKSKKWYKCLGLGKVEGGSETPNEPDEPDEPIAPNTFILSDGSQFLVRDENGDSVPFLFKV